MKLYRLQQTQALPIPLAAAWAFFANPANLPLITPPDLGFRVTSPLPARMYAGMIVSYTVTPFVGLPVAWVTEITRAEEPRFFVDEQRCGPYRFWHHQHLFREVAGGTEMTDLVHYRLPFEPLSRLIAPLVQRRLAGIFAYRRRVLEERFGRLSGAAGGGGPGEAG
ncbi:SRPBCC domain-containing protein [Geotalea uraniireducens]|uniref:SRPBCC domain-containing protein n=1 Tax=Geotalea uraniireducens TaxID=351604 RepID=A0ABM8EQA3_9BACT|nr:SRPBCC family protein [Geotalea uraniireducens]BDV44658.1 SRPBCC domain-containing protein [Geotalea uraniireducens]